METFVKDLKTNIQLLQEQFQLGIGFFFVDKIDFACFAVQENHIANRIIRFDRKSKWLHFQSQKPQKIPICNR